MPGTRHDRVLAAIKNHPVGVVLLLAAAVVGVLYSPLKDVAGALRGSPPLEILAKDNVDTTWAVDLTIRNPSNRDAVIHRIEAEIRNDSMPRFLCTGAGLPTLPGPMTASADYVVDMDWNAGRVSGYRNIRHLAPAHAADRFTISTLPHPACYVVRITLKYDRSRSLSFIHDFTADLRVNGDR